MDECTIGATSADVTEYHARNYRDPKNLHIYVLRQYLSHACRREIQLLTLSERVGKMLILRQAQGNNFPYVDARVYPIRKYANPTGLLTKLWLDRWKQNLDQYFFPGPIVFFLKPAERFLLKAIRADYRRHNRVCLVTPVPPHGLVMPGLSLKRKFPDLRWVVDWQDLWTHDSFYFGQVPRSRRDRICELERSVFDSADVNVFTNPQACEYASRRYALSTEKVRVIPHAFEDEDIVRTSNKQARLESNNQELTLGFLGNLFKPPKVPGEKVIAALDYVRSMGCEIEFHIFGDKYLEKVSRLPIAGRPWIVVHDPMPHAESLIRLAACDLLLLVLGDVPEAKSILHAKLPFYLVQGKPILAIVPDQSAVADVIRKTETGWVIPSEQNWNESLMQTLLIAQANGFATNRIDSEISKFSWKEISQLWLEVIRGY